MGEVVELKKGKDICPWCTTLLGDEGKYYGSCKDHRNCKSCNGPLHPAEIVYCAHNDLEPQHSRCMATLLRPEQMTDETIVVSQALLDKLNLARLLITPVPEWGAETNAQDAMFKTHSFVHDMSLEEKFLFLRRMEAITAQMSVLLKKDKKAIEKELQERANKQFEAAKQQVKKQHESLPTVKKKLSNREKAIQALVNAGMDLATATISVDAQLVSQGKTGTENK